MAGIDREELLRQLQLAGGGQVGGMPIPPPIYGPPPSANLNPPPPVMGPPPSANPMPVYGPPPSTNPNGPPPPSGGADEPLPPWVVTDPSQMTGAAQKKREAGMQAPIPPSPNAPKQDADAGGAVFADNPQTAMPQWRPPPMQIIPAHEGQTTSPRVERQMLLGQNRIEAGAREGIDAEAAAQEGLSKLHDRRAEQYEDFAQQQEKREDARQRIINGHFKDQENLAQEIRSQKFDPEGFWGKGAEGATKKVTAVIAQALGGFVQGMRGGPNAATQMIDAAQDRYMDSMKQQMAAKKETLAEGSNLLAQKMRQFGDERTAELAAKDDMLHATQAQIESFMAQSQSAAVRARGDQLLGEIQQKRGELMNKLHPWVQAQAVGGMGGAGGAGGAGTLEGEALHLGGGMYVQAKGPIGTDLAKNMQANTAVVSGLKQLRTLIKQRDQLTAAGGNASQLEQQISQIQNDLIPRMSNATGAGAPSEGDTKRAIESMGLNQGLAGLLRPDSTKAVDQAIKRYESVQKSNLQTVGGTTYRKVGQRIGKGGKWEDLYIPGGDVTDMPDPNAAPPPASASFKPAGGK